jgi:uncharacterized coiled-coil protein SlyX
MWLVGFEKEPIMVALTVFRCSEGEYNPGASSKPNQPKREPFKYPEHGCRIGMSPIKGETVVIQVEELRRLNDTIAEQRAIIARCAQELEALRTSLLRNFEPVDTQEELYFPASESKGSK